MSKPTIKIKLHRWNQSPYAGGPAYTFAAEVLYIKKIHNKTKNLCGFNGYYDENGILHEGYVLTQARVAAFEHDCTELMNKLRTHYNIRIMKSEPYISLYDHPERYIDISELKEQL